MEKRQASSWHTVEELIDIGYQYSRVVMMNECHAGWFRCIRTRRIGQRILPVAHQLGVRYLAMEALYSPVTKEANRTRILPSNAWGYLEQPEMRSFIQTALDLGWTLITYEADFEQEPPDLSSLQRNNWREEQQAEHLITALNSLSETARLLVWCGNNHHTKALIPIRDGEPGDFCALMGYHFRLKSGIDPFVIDQGVTVEWPDAKKVGYKQWLKEITPTLVTFGGTAGFLAKEAPACLPVCPGNDAYVVSLDNAMEEWIPTGMQ
ncbi:MAG TPA: hypothetical protein VFA41_10900 [Ktedonobacteraceae bacterium]|jgi:hypothetical protein|nr:hypothetical protein [Ktedonobacteraceae bacterium]